MGSTLKRKGAGPDTCWGVRARPYGAVGRVYCVRFSPR